MSDTESHEVEDFDVEDSFPSPDSATVTIEGPGISITRSVGEATMSSIIALLFGGPAAVAGGAPIRQPQPQHQQQHQPAGGNAQPWDPDLTLGEFLEETGARTFPQKICAAGYYLIKLKGRDSFDREGVKAALVSAHEDMPANFSRDFTAAASAKLIAAKPDQADQYFVTTTGRKAVDSRFQDVPKRRPSRRRRTSAASGDAE